MPSALVGAWSLGSTLQGTALQSTLPWQLAALGDPALFRGGQGGVGSALALGAAFFLPLLLISLLTSRVWAEGFARSRGRSLDKDWWLVAWLYTLLLPAGIPLIFAAVGLSFGYVFGSLVFGGSGRHLVHPALLGVAFLAIAYPDQMGAGYVLPGTDTTSSWTALATGAAPDSLPALGEVLLGRQVGALGASSALAALLGLAYLLARRLVPWDLPLAALLGLGLASSVMGAHEGYWHLALGNFAFLLAFFLGDPATRPREWAARWMFAAGFAGLTVALRVTDPQHPEASVAALLLLCLVSPFLDYLVVAAKRPLARGLSDS